MKILRSPIQELTFADVEAFLAEGIIEGIQIDYKKDLSDKGLAKHFAAFSNARGGLIIIGVQEDTSTGKPTKWEGIDPAGKLEDRIHQYASNVDPTPSYEVHSTDANSDGKVFILVRIQEGDRTPYYVQNEATIYVRTGNVTKRCEEPASPQETARLIEKRENARFARELNLNRAELVYESVVERFHKQHERWHRANLATTVYSKAPVPEKAVCTIALQPHFPNVTLASPRQIFTALTDMRLKVHRASNPNWVCSEGESMQDGVLLVNSNTEHNARLNQCHQVFSSGLVFERRSLTSRYSPGVPSELYLSRLVDEIYHFLIASRSIYKSIHYQGGLVGYIELSGLKDMFSRAFAPTQDHVYEPMDILLPSYTWPLLLDTAILFDLQGLKKYLVYLVDEIGWSFGWDYPHQQLLDYHIQQWKWFRA